MSSRYFSVSVISIFFSVILQGICSLRPNIIVIIGDDIGWNDFGFHGSDQIPTPNIDALGYNGAILHGFYTQHICSPSRAAFLTGQYPIRTGFQGSPLKAGENRSLPLDVPLMPEVLKNLGYRTHLVGKWHLGAAYRQVTPLGRGFDSHFGYWNGYCGYFDYYIDQEMPGDTPSMNGFDLHDNFKPAWPLLGRYSTELFTEKSLEIIEGHDVDEPLFLVLSHLAGHTGSNGSELGVPNINETDTKYSYIEDPRRRRYADLINIMDDSVGKIVEKLSEKSMLENSVVLFFSDNGAPTVGIYDNTGSNWPFKGIKATLYEGGVRGSATIYSHLFAKKRYVNGALIHVTDFLPTFYAAAGGNVDNLGQIDGINQWHVLSQDVKSERNEMLLNIDEKDGSSGILVENRDRTRFKLLNGTSSNGTYDHYYGESGRGFQTPRNYNVTQILHSAVNLAIRKLPPSMSVPQNSPQLLTSETILQLRSQVNLENCSNSSELPKEVDCSGFCLFDLSRDPCETRDVSGEFPDVLEQLKAKLARYQDEIVLQQNVPADRQADPKYYNGTWCTWLDDEECVKSKSGSGSTSHGLQNGFLASIMGLFLGIVFGNH